MNKMKVSRIQKVSFMNWYISKIVFRISTAEAVQRPQFDEQLRLVAAASEEEAFLKARMIGIREEDAFINGANKTVRWEFINVAEVIELSRLEDGVEIYSQIHETDEEKAYIDCIHQKAIYLRTHAKTVETRDVA